MCVRLERNVRRAAACFFPGDVERDRLRVLDVFENVKTPANDLPCSTNDHTTNEWPRTHLAHALRGQIERTRHHFTIRVGPDCWFSYTRLHKNGFSSRISHSRTAADRRPPDHPPD